MNAVVIINIYQIDSCDISKQNILSLLGVYKNSLLNIKINLYIYLQSNINQDLSLRKRIRLPYDFERKSKQKGKFR